MLWKCSTYKTNWYLVAFLNLKIIKIIKTLYEYSKFKICKIKDKWEG